MLVHIGANQMRYQAAPLPELTLPLDSSLAQHKPGKVADPQGSARFRPAHTYRRCMGDMPYAPSLCPHRITPALAGVMGLATAAP